MVTKPEVNGSTGTWGTILNTALDDLQGQVTTVSNTAGTNSSSITTLSGRVSTAETNITTLQAAGGFYSGTAAARAANTNYNLGGHYYETDTGRHWVGTSARWVPMPGSILLKARQTTLQSLATSGTAAAVTFQTVDYDRLSNFASSTYTVTIPGWYELTGGCAFANNATGYRGVFWFVNGASVSAGGATMAPNASVASALSARPLSVLLAATDTVQLYAVQTSGGALDTFVSSAQYQASMQVKYLGPA